MVVAIRRSVIRFFCLLTRGSDLRGVNDPQSGLEELPGWVIFMGYMINVCSFSNPMDGLGLVNGGQQVRNHVENPLNGSFDSVRRYNLPPRCSSSRLTF